MNIDDARQSAEIIPFPSSGPNVPAAPQAAAGGDDDPAQRLIRALRMLEAAQAEQRLALARWRSAMGELSGGVEKLGLSLSAYQDRLSDLAMRVQPPS